MYTIVTLFGSHEQARNAMLRLQNAGVAADDVTVVMRGQEEDSAAGVDGDFAAESTVGGAVVGGITGLLMGLGVLAIPGAAPLLVAGPLAGAIAGSITGAATGGLLGALVDVGIDESDAAAYQTRVEQGEILLAVHANEAEIDTVRTVMSQYGLPIEEYVESPR